MKSIVITGSGGFLGRHLIKAFNSDVKIFAASSKSVCDSIIPNNIEYISNSQLKTLKWDAVDVLINCAYPRQSTGTEIAEGLQFIQSVLTTAVEGGVKSVINISSQSLYSQKRRIPATESTALCLETNYAIGKYAVELLVDTVCKGINHTNLRMASLLGVGFEARLVNRFIRKALAGEEIVISGGNQLFGFLDVRDAADAIGKIAVSEKDWRQCYNLGPASDLSLLEIVNMIKLSVQKMCCVDASVIIKGEGEWQNSSLNSQLLYSDFSWQPEIPLQKTIDDILINILSDFSISTS